MAPKPGGEGRKRALGMDGERIAKAREALGLTQWELANRVGIHPQRISELERNYRSAAEKLSIGKALELADVLGRSLHWLCGRE